MADEKKGKVYVVNGFSPSMLSIMPSAVEFHEVSTEEFCSTIKNDNVVSAIGHQSTTSLINQLCGSNIPTNRIAIKVGISDTLYIVNISVRLEEGKVLTDTEMKQLLAEGKVKFIRAKVFGAVLEELANCYQKCDERTYDTIAYRAKNGGQQ